MRAAVVVFLLAPATALGMLLPAPPATAGDGIAVRDLVARFERAGALATAGAPDPSPRRMDEVRAAAGLPVTVLLGRDRTVFLPEDPLLRGLRGDRAADFEEATVRLGTLLRGATGALGAAPVDAARVEAGLRSAYRGINQVPSWRLRLSRWMGALLNRFFGLFSGLGGATVFWRLAGYVLLVVMGVVGLVLLRRLLRQIGIVPSGRQVLPAGTSERADWAAMAEDALRRGDTREAVRALYRGLVEQLTDKGLVPDLPSLTPRECRAALRRDGRLSPAVDQATTAFERVVYGRAPASSDDVEALLAAGRAARAA